MERRLGVIFLIAAAAIALVVAIASLALNVGAEIGGSDQTQTGTADQTGGGPAGGSHAIGDTGAAGAYSVVRVVDGDTVVLADDTRVRLLGIDAPESGECGFAEAAAKLTELVQGRSVILTGDELDRFGRRLAYIDVAGVDAGARLIEAGLARPRYNATDGFGENPRDLEYFELAGNATHMCNLDLLEFAN